MKRFIAVFMIFILAPLYADNLSYSRAMLIQAYPAISSTGENIGSAMPGLNAFSSNPAAIASIAGLNFSAMHNAWLMSVNGEKASAGMPFDFGAIAAEISYINYGTLMPVELDTLGNPVFGTGEYNMYSVYGSLGFARAITGGFSAGAAVKYSMDSMGAYSDGYMGFDIGAQYAPEGAVRAGVSLVNLSGETGGYSLPMEAKAGALYGFEQDGKKFGCMGAGLGYLIKDGTYKAEAGGSVRVLDAVEVRLGANYSNEGFSFTAGGGFSYGSFMLDYGFVPAGALGSAHRVSFSYNMGGPGKEAKESEFYRYLIGAETYYKDKQYAAASKYFLYVMKNYTGEIKAMPDEEKSNFYQKAAITFYNLKNNRYAEYYFKMALKYDPENEAVKQWLNMVK